jgi:16S rRNA (cytosine967-C5)-methyltransferase
LVNAVLRRATERREQLLEAQSDETVKGAAAMHSIPRWIAELWWQERGPERARALMAASNRPPSRLLRVNEAGAPRAETVAGLAAVGVELAGLDSALPGAASLVEVVEGPWGPIEAAIEAGTLLPQSLGSATAAALVDAAPGERVLDLCAAPGIKTTQLAAAVGPGGEVVAVERDEGRARELERLCVRAGLGNVDVRVGDGTRLELGSGYDRILVDAPCSGLGTLASRPDLRWRRGPDQIGPLHELQGELIAAGAAALRPGGSLLYSVCTISREEGAGVVSAIAAGDVEVAGFDDSLAGFADDEDPRYLQLLPDRDGTDGFFIARLERKPA